MIKEANEFPVPEGEGLGVGSVISCSAEPTAAVSISIYNARKIIGLQILILLAVALQMLPNWKSTPPGLPFPRGGTPAEPPLGEVWRGLFYY